jgi:hypothetical protein
LSSLKFVFFVYFPYQYLFISLNYSLLYPIYNSAEPFVTLPDCSINDVIFTDIIVEGVHIFQCDILYQAIPSYEWKQQQNVLYSAFHQLSSLQFSGLDLACDEI